MVAKKKLLKKKSQKKKRVQASLKAMRIAAGFKTRQAFCDAYKETEGNENEELNPGTLFAYENGSRPSIRRWEGILRTLKISLTDKRRRNKLFKDFGFSIGGSLREVARHSLHTSKLGDWHKPKKVSQKTTKVAAKNEGKKSAKKTTAKTIKKVLQKKTKKKAVTYCELKKVFAPFIGKKPTKVQELLLKTLLATFQKKKK